MKLSFRGASYEYHPSELEVTEGEIGGRYRGSSWRIHRCKQQHRRSQNPTELVYRGIHYKRN